MVLHVEPFTYRVIGDTATMQGRANRQNLSWVKNCLWKFHAECNIPYRRL